MTKDIHEQSVGAVCAVQLFPLPVRARPGSLGSSVNFLKAPCPLRIVANPLIRERVKVSMPAILATSEDDAGNFSIRTLIEKSMSRREPQIAEAQLGS